MKRNPRSPQRPSRRRAPTEPTVGENIFPKVNARETKTPEGPHEEHGGVPHLPILSFTREDWSSERFCNYRLTHESAIALLPTKIKIKPWRAEREGGDKHTPHDRRFEQMAP